ncbi:hypothetical protein BJ912DRAFT_1058476 [Pholiota molesta]|nr:hypothetical protein BJ912DRAFT_1058476 [Pholiota molesta]
MVAALSFQPQSMDTSTISPSDRGPLFSDAVSAELEHADSSKSTSELQQFDSLQSPFYDLDSDELLEELWEEGANREFKTPSYFPKIRGNYVRSYVLSELRIQAKSTRLEVGWDLEALWDALPVELIISIFEFLHPIDLYHAIQTTKGLRSFLLNKNSTTIWKESFLNHPDIPFYPPGVSAPKWTSLLFGPATCDTCGDGNCLVDYNLHIRKCDDCIDDFYSDNEELLNEIKLIIGEFTDQMSNIWILATRIHYFDPFLYIGDDEYNELGSRPRYSLKNITERAHEMRKFLLDIRSGVPDAQTTYETFLRITKAAVEEHMKQARRCEEWAADIYADCEDTFLTSVSVFLAKNEKALLSQGRNPRDVKQAHNIFKWSLDQFKYAEVSDPVFSESRLRWYLPQLESILDECMISRLSEERAQRVDARQAHICTLYFKTTKEILTRDKAPYLPHPQKLYTHQFFADYINDPKELVDELDASAQQEVLRFIETSWAAKKRQLLTVLLQTGLLEEATEDSNPDDYLGLAMAVFECCHSVFVGWEGAGTHIQCSPSPTNTNAVGDVDSAASIRFNDTGYQALGTWLSSFALISDLRLHGLHAMTWRECLTHAMKMLSDSSEVERHVVFDILSEALTTSIIAVEKPFLPAVKEDWACKHCNFWFEPAKRAEMVAHFKQAHGIPPVEGIHFVYCRPEITQTRTVLFVGLDENSNHRCLRCWAARKLRLWKKTPDLLRHILDKHSIQAKDTVEGVDWIKVKAVEDESWIEGKIRAEEFVLA